MGPDQLASSAGMQRQQRQEPPIEHNLPCSLEELFKGSTRKMKISRTVHNAAGRPERISEILSIDIKPGWKKGTRITFPEKGALCVLHKVHNSQLQPSAILSDATGE